MKWLAWLALVGTAFAVEIPKDFGKSIHVAEMAGAKGPAIDEGRLLLCAFLFADEMGVLDKPMPWIVAVHADQRFNEHIAMAKYGVKVEFSTSRVTGDVTYWAYMREANDYAYLSAVGTVFLNSFQVPADKREELLSRVRAKFLLMVDVKSMEKH